MANSIIGASSIEKEDFSCLIKSVVCEYKIGDKNKSAVLYDRDRNLVPTNCMEENEDNALNAASGVILGGISFVSNVLNYYYISNHNGKEINLICNRIANYCNDDEHSKYFVEHSDIQNVNEISITRKSIEDGKIKLYYYNLFYRRKEYANAMANRLKSREYSGNKTVQFVSREIGAGVGYISGLEAGDIVDTLFAFRFITLPKLDDNIYRCYVDLNYNECPNHHNIPKITILIYPDIKFLLKLGVMGVSVDYNKNHNGNVKKSNTNFEFEFTVKYADITKLLSFDNSVEKSLGPEERKGLFFYKSIGFFANLFKEASNLTKEISKCYDGDKASVGNDLASLSSSLGKTGGVLGKSSKWLSGSFDFKPILEAEWEYKTSDDLTALRKHLKIELSVSCEGRLIVDLVELYNVIFDNVGKTTTVVAIGTTVATGGLGAWVGVLLNFVVKHLVKWLKDLLKSGFKAEIEFIGKASASAISYDSLEEKKLDIGKITIGPEVKITVGIEYKTSLTLGLKYSCIPVADFEFQNLRETEEEKKKKEVKKKTKNLDNTLEGVLAAGLSVEAAISMAWEINFDVTPQGSLASNNIFRIKPFTLTVEYHYVDSFKIEMKKNNLHGQKQHKVNRSMSWEFKELVKGPYIWMWFGDDNVDDKSKTKGDGV